MLWESSSLGRASSPTTVSNALTSWTMSSLTWVLAIPFSILKMVRRPVLPSTSLRTTTSRSLTRDNQCFKLSHRVTTSNSHLNFVSSTASQTLSGATPTEWEPFLQRSNRHLKRSCRVSSQWSRSFSKWRSGRSGTLALILSPKRLRAESWLYHNSFIRKVTIRSCMPAKDCSSRCLYSLVILSKNFRCSSSTTDTRNERQSKSTRP